MEENAEISPQGWEQYDSLLNTVDRTLAALLRLADRDAETLTRCLVPELEPLWELCWAKMNVQPTLNESLENSAVPYRPLLPQPYLPAFYRLLGLHFFHCGSKPGQRALLVKAAQAPYSNFQAQRALVEQYLADLGKDPAALSFALVMAKKAAAVHHTPGYVLLAKSQFDIGCYLHDSDRERSAMFFEQAYKNLVIAEVLQPYCQNSLHNAYHGLGIIQSNGFGLATISALQTHFVRFIEGRGMKLNVLEMNDQGLREGKALVLAFYQSTQTGKQPLFKKSRISFNASCENTYSF
jgi:Family of unknown function (DUF5630)